MSIGCFTASFVVVFVFQSEAIAVCKHHFPPECFVSQLDTPCDVAVVMFSEMLLDDPPSNDPRWSGGGGKGERRAKKARASKKYDNLLCCTLSLAMNGWAQCVCL